MRLIGLVELGFQGLTQLPVSYANRNRQQSHDCNERVLASQAIAALGPHSDHLRNEEHHQQCQLEHSQCNQL